MGPLKERHVVGLWSGTEADFDLLLRHLKEKVFTKSNGHVRILGVLCLGALERPKLQALDLQLQPLRKIRLRLASSAFKVFSPGKRNDFF